MKTKICSTCKKEKEASIFAFKSKKIGLRRSVCNVCQKIYARQHYLDNRQVYIDRAKIYNVKKQKELYEYILKYKEAHPCIDCSETNPIVLEFDHIRGKKICSISEIPRRQRSLKKLKKEIKKCEVRCANCHRIRHYNIRNNI